MEKGLRIDISGGMNLVDSPDQIAPGHGMPYLENVRRTLQSRTKARDPLGSNLLASPLQAGITSVTRMADQYKSSPAYAYLSGANDSLYVDVNQVVSGLSGNPISFLPYRPPSSPQPWAYVADDSLAASILNPSYSSYSPPVTGMVKVRSDGTCYKMGVMEPQDAPVVSVGSGTGTNWVSYRSVYRSSITGALSNPSPASPPQLQPQSSDASSLPCSNAATNFIFNGSQYELNGTEIRTKGSVAAGTLTDYVQAYGFGLSVPSGVTVDGVQVSVNWLGQYAGTGIASNVALFYQGAVLGTPYSPGTPNSQTATTLTEGGPGNSWGTVLTPEIVNDPSFGFGLQILTAESGGSDRSFLISYTITVYYTVVSNTGTVTSSTDPQVDTIDIYRQTPGLANFTYVLSIPNTTTSFTDTLSDLTISNNPILSFANYEPFPSIDLPRSGICTVSTVNQEVTNINVVTEGSGQTDGTYSIPGSGGGGTGATVQIVITGGVITSATVTASGSGYTSAPTFTVSEGGTPGTLVASIGPILPLQANVTFVSGDAFNARWLPGDIINIDGIAYTLYSRPGKGIGSPTTLTAYQTATTATGYISYGFPPAGTNLKWFISAPSLAAQPSPVLWGPTPDSGGGNFMLGLDPLNPGDLVISQGNNFDSAPGTNRQYVCSPSEGLVNGIVTSELNVVFSPERFWLLYSNSYDAVATVTGTQGILFVPVQSSATRGLFMRYALGGLGALLAWRAKDGIFISEGGGPEKDISGNIYNLFPHGEETASAVTIGNKTVYPPDDTNEKAQTIAVVPGYIFYNYQDTTGTPRTLVFDMEAKGWIVDSYTPTVNCHALPVGVNQILAGCTDGTIRAFDAAGTESGTAVIITPAENQGSTRIQKRIGGVFLRAVAASAVTLGFWASRIQTAITGFSPATVGTAATEDDYYVDFTSATGADVVDLACEFSWTLGSGNILSEWQPDWTYLPASIIGYKTGKTSYGMEAWGHFEWIDLAYKSTATVTLVMTPDNGSAVTLTFPSTGGIEKKQWMSFPANKFKIVGWTANSTEPFSIDVESTQALLAGWGTSSRIIRPFEEGWGKVTT